MIDDEIVTDFSRIPEEKNHVYIKLVPEGDNEKVGTGMKAGGVLAVIGGIAAIATLGWTGVGGVLGASLIGAGIGCFAGGTVLYNLNVEIPSTQKNKSPEQDPSIRGSENQMRPYGVIPTLFGKRRIYADSAAKSYTWAENGSIYLYQLFCAGQKDMTIDTSTIKIDETLLKDYSASGNINTILSGNDPLIDLRIHQDGTMPVLYNKCVHEKQVNAILLHESEDGVDGSIIRTTPEGTEEINVDVFFPNGLGRYDDKGTLNSTSVQLAAYYKQADADDSGYQLLGYFSETQATTHTARITCTLSARQKVTVETLWTNYGSWSYLTEGWRPAQEDKSTCTTKIYSTKKNYRTTYYGHDDNKERTTHISTTVIFGVELYQSATGTNVLTGNELKTKRFTITKPQLVPDTYTVKISRITDDSDDSKVVDDVYIGSIRAAKHVPPVRPERANQLTLIEVKIKASEKLQNVVKQLNFVAQSKLPSYSGDGSGSARWIDRLSSNPAAASIYAIQGGFAQQRLSDSEIDWPAFERLYNWCSAHEYECNAYLAESIPISNLLSTIASTCRAEILRLNGKITVIQDIERDSFTQLFTPRNSHDYSEQIALADIPDALNLTFVDKNNGYAENFARVYNTPNGNYAGEPDTTQEVQLWGVTSDEQARKIGMYNYAVTKHRFIIHKFSADFEYLMCTKGDWIKYAGDLALAGITQGRITDIGTDAQGKTTAFECDEELPMESGKSYGMRVRKADGQSVIIYLENVERSSKVAILSSAIEASASPQPGDLFTFGEVSGAKLDDAIDLIITDIQCGENLSADLTCVEYSPEIFGVDEPNFELPEFENHLSEVQGKIDMGQVWQTFYTYHDGDETPNTPTGDGTEDGWHHIRTPESNWVSVKTAATIYDGVWCAPSYAKGPQGEQGEKGDKGDKGDPGANGADGKDGKDGKNGGYQDYQFAVGNFGLTDSQARALTWYDAPPNVPDGKCLYMATKWIAGE